MTLSMESLHWLLLAVHSIVIFEEKFPSDLLDERYLGCKSRLGKVLYWSEALERIIMVSSVRVQRNLKLKLKRNIILLKTHRKKCLLNIIFMQCSVVLTISKSWVRLVEAICKLSCFKTMELTQWHFWGWEGNSLYTVYISCMV